MIQELKNYTKEDQKVWNILFDRQIINLKNKASNDYLMCLNNMESVLNARQIPNFNDINKWFESNTGWQIEVVPGLIPVEDFFILLSEKKFCSSTWLRSMKELDYLEEPDMFHDIFGHIPLLANPIFSKFALEFGKLGVRNIDDTKFLEQLQRLYWFTIEFGLINTENGRRIYGAGLISSFGESISSLTNEVQVLPFDLEKILNQTFKSDAPQNLYFEINDLNDLYIAIMKLKNKEWVITDSKLEKTFELNNFEHVVKFINQITPTCESMNHHPDFTVFDYKKIKFQLSTHDLNVVGEKDYLLARAIDQIRHQ